MLQHVLFDLTLFGPGDERAQAEKNLCWMMEALVQRNQSYLRAHPNTPKLYKSGVVYQVPKQFDGECEEVRVLKSVLGALATKPDVAAVLAKVQSALGGEIFRDIGRIIENGGGDCDNLACWRVAELRQAGIQARPFMTSRKRKDGGTTYHALVIWPALGSIGNLGDGGKETTEDPSLILGMSQPQRAADRLEELRKNAERCEILKKRGQTKAAADVDGILQEVLGLRRQRQVVSPSVSEPSERDLDTMLGRRLDAGRRMG